MGRTEKNQKGFISFRWLLILGLLAGGVIVYAKENSSTFLMDSPGSSRETSSRSVSKIENTVGDIKGSFKKLSEPGSANDKELEKLAEPQSLTKKQEANFYEAALSEINQSKNNITGKVDAVVNCIEQADKNKQ